MASAAILCKVFIRGPKAYCITLPPALRKEAGLVNRDVVGFRVVSFQGRTLLIGEKVALNSLGVLKEVPAEALHTIK